MSSRGSSQYLQYLQGSHNPQGSHDSKKTTNSSLQPSRPYFIMGCENPFAKADKYEKRSSENSGIDLFFPKNVIIPPGECVLVDLEIKVALFENSGTMKRMPFMLVPRSSIYKHGIILANGVGIIDAGYQGNLKAPLRNLGQEPYTCKEGESLLQVVAPTLEPTNLAFVILEHDYFAEKTERGEGGFGSTN